MPSGRCSNLRAYLTFSRPPKVKFEGHDKCKLYISLISKDIEGRKLLHLPSLKLPTIMLTLQE